MFAASTVTYTKYLRKRSKSLQESKHSQKFQVVFVLGGPGSGKGTQCSLLSSNIPNWRHLSAGDLLRAERKSGSDLANLINDKISNGEIVPANITVNLIKAAMERANEENEAQLKFIIDGFPRSEGNVSVWKEVMSEVTKLEFVLFLDCPEDIMTGRLLDRGKTNERTDDNLETIRKRFRTFREGEMPIVKVYENEKGMLKHVRADRSIDDVYEEVKGLFIDI